VSPSPSSSLEHRLSLARALGSDSRRRRYGKKPFGEGRPHQQHIQGIIGDGGAPHNNSWERDEFQTDETEDETVITVETPPAVMLPAWVNFLQQRLYVLHVDYKHIGAGRIGVVSTPRATESVARLVISTVEIADYYVKTLFRNMAHGVQHHKAANGV
jgi:hypothetical protein